MTIERNKWIGVQSSQVEKAMVRMAPGESSFVDLAVKFNNGASIYTYIDVPVEVAEGLFSAESPGKYLNEHVEGVYGFNKEVR